MSLPYHKIKPHPIATIFREGVLENPEFSFNNVSQFDVSDTASYDVYECNLKFPQKNGYCISDPRNTLNGGEGHPDDKRSFFFWRDYDELDSYDEDYHNPEWMISHHRDYIFDGTTNHWSNRSPHYDCDDEPDGIEVPRWFNVPDTETPTDISRRRLYVRKNLCIWALLGCNCGTGGTTCLKRESERFDLVIGYQS